MKNNKVLWIVFGVIQHLFSWVSVLIYTIIKYGVFIQSNGFVFAGLFTLAFAIWMIMRSLKETAKHGYALNAKIARGIRGFIPLVLMVVVVLVLNTNIGGLVNLLLVAGIGNIVALPFGVLSYYASPQYIIDTGMLHLVEKSKE